MRVESSNFNDLIAKPPRPQFVNVEFNSNITYMGSRCSSVDLSNSSVELIDCILIK